MIQDAALQLSDAQAVTVSAISNVIDTGTDPSLKPLGNGDGPHLLVRTRKAFTDAGSDATLTVSLESSTTADLATAPTVHFSTGPIAFANFSALDAQLLLTRLPAGIKFKKYVGLRYTVANGPLADGQIDAVLSLDATMTQSYANGAIT
jgi:hypothetical protein